MMVSPGVEREPDIESTEEDEITFWKIRRKISRE
jgi:hypothetical protein